MNTIKEKTDQCMTIDRKQTSGLTLLEEKPMHVRPMTKGRMVSSFYRRND